MDYAANGIAPADDRGMMRGDSSKFPAKRCAARWMKWACGAAAGTMQRRARRLTRWKHRSMAEFARRATSVGWGSS